MAGSASGTSFNFTNSCNFTVWVGVQPNGGIPLLVGGGFTLASGATNAVSAPVAWGGRFWGRTGNEGAAYSLTHSTPQRKSGFCSSERWVCEEFRRMSGFYFGAISYKHINEILEAREGFVSMLSL